MRLPTWVRTEGGSLKGSPRPQANSSWACCAWGLSSLCSAPAVSLSPAMQTDGSHPRWPRTANDLSFLTAGDRADGGPTFP